MFYEVAIWPGVMLGSQKFFFAFVINVCAYFDCVTIRKFQTRRVARIVAWKKWHSAWIYIALPTVSMAYCPSDIIY